MILENINSLPGNDHNLFFRTKVKKDEIMNDANPY